MARADELEAQGKRVVHFSVGEPDFATAEPIVAAGQAALANGATKYTPAVGIAPLREAIAAHYADLGVALDVERIIVTAGASGGLTLLMAQLLNPGEELLITDPGYPCNEVFVRLVGGIPRPVTVGPDTHYQPSADDLASAWSAATRGALLASPANPTGSMLDKRAVLEIARLVQARDGFLILDEIYQGLMPDANRAGYRTGLEITHDPYVLNSFSKYFGMTGWRLGWIVVPAQAVPGLTKLAQNLFISPSAPAQHAALAAFSPEAMAIHEARVAEFGARERLLREGLESLGFSIPVYPDGAFYLYVDVSHTGMHSREFAWRLLDEFQVAVTPGEDFGKHLHDRFVRFAYTTDQESIQLGVTRIGEALRAWGIA